MKKPTCYCLPDDHICWQSFKWPKVRQASILVSSRSHDLKEVPEIELRITLYLIFFNPFTHSFSGLLFPWGGSRIGRNHPRRAQNQNTSRPTRISDNSDGSTPRWDYKPRLRFSHSTWSLDDLGATFAWV